MRRSKKLMTLPFYEFHIGDTVYDYITSVCSDRKRIDPDGKLRQVLSGVVVNANSNDGAIEYFVKYKDKDTPEYAPASFLYATKEEAKAALIEELANSMAYAQVTAEQLVRDAEEYRAKVVAYNKHIEMVRSN
jgi:hypothetical protein